MNRFTTILILFLFISSSIYSQEEKKKIEYQSGTLYTNEKLGPDIKVLVDEVVFTHGNAIMKCDSALFNPADNYFEAFGSIKIIKPMEQRQDTVFLYGDTLRYNGDEKIASMRNKVKLINDSLQLYTNFLDYKLTQDLGYYFNHGTSINNEDTLSSTYGYYYAQQKEFFFKDKVVVKNPKFEMHSDTLKHNTNLHISYFYGASEIFSEENYIYCEDGWYNHDKNVSQFKKNVLMQNKSQTLKAQQINYNRNNGIGHAHKQVEISDTTKGFLIKSNYGYYDEQKDYTLLTDSAIFIKINDLDSLYMHADTIQSSYQTAPTQPLANDTLSQRFRIIQAHHHTKIFKSDFQAKCDSLIYTFRDSVIELHGNPILWAEKNQITANYIYILTANNQLQQINIEQNALIISKSDSVRFNQLKGDKMIGLAEDNELTQINIYQNSESLYFVKDDFGKLIGLNHIKCKDMNIYLKDQKIDKIWFYEKPTSVMKPPNALSEADKKLEGFKWEEAQRPKKPTDIFIK